MSIFQKYGLVVLILISVFNWDYGNAQSVENYSIAVDSLIASAIRHNPNVLQKQQAYNKAVQQIDLATKLPNPSFSVGYFLVPIETAVGPQQYKLGLKQPIPWPTKLILKKEISSLYADAVFHSLETAILELNAEIRQTYFQYYYTDQAIKLLSLQVDLLKDYSTILKNKYEAGLANQVDRLNTQIQLEKLSIQLDNLENDKLNLIHTLALKTGINNLQNIDIPDSLPLPEPLAEKEELLTLITTNNPVLKSIDKQVQMARLAVKQKRLDYLPNFGIGADYIFTGDKYNSSGALVTDSGKDPLALSLSLDLPIWFGKNSKNVKVAETGLSEMQETYNSTELQLTIRLENLLNKMANLAETIMTYHEVLIPATETTIHLNEAIFKSDIDGYADLFTAINTYYQYRLQYEKSLSQYFQKLAALTALTGGSL